MNLLFPCNNLLPYVHLHAGQPLHADTPSELLLSPSRGAEGRKCHEKSASITWMPKNEVTSGAFSKVGTITKGELDKFIIF